MLFILCIVKEHDYFNHAVLRLVLVVPAAAVDPSSCSKDRTSKTPGREKNINERDKAIQRKE